MSRRDIIDGVIDDNVARIKQVWPHLGFVPTDPLHISLLCDDDFPGKLHYPDELVMEVLLAYLNERKVCRLLNPHSMDGLLTGRILQHTNASHCLEVIADGMAQKVSEVLNDHRDIVRTTSFEFNPSGADEPDCDLIVSYMLPQGQPQEATLHVDGTAYPLLDYASSLLILQSCFLLRDDGECLFLTDESFFNHSPDSVLENLHRIGLRLKAAIAFPEQRSCLTGESETLLIIGRTPQQRLFVGNPEGLLEVESFIDNLKNREEGASPSRGRLVDMSRYYGWSFHDAGNKVDYDAAGCSLPVKSLGEITSRIAVLSNGLITERDTTPNSFALQIDDEQTAIVCVLPDEALAEFVAGFISSNDAYAANVRTVCGIPRTRFSSLSRKEAERVVSCLSIPLPPIDVQKSAVATQHRISILQDGLRSAERGLWNDLGRVDRVDSALDALTSRPAERTWAASLPTPLASTLRQYEAAHDLSTKIDYLKDFFEVFGIYLFDMLFSVVISDHELYEKSKDLWVQRKGGVPLRKMHFGSLLYFTMEIAKTLRYLLDADPVQWTHKLFGTEDAASIGPFVSRKPLDILNSAVSFRNDRSHLASATSEEEKQELLARGSRCLESLRSAFGDAFDQWELVKPQGCKSTSNHTVCTYTLLKGSDSVMNTGKRQTSSPVMNTEDLYLFASGSTTPIRLAPFIRLLRVGRPERDAFYCYNKTEGTKMRWVSYHCPGESQRTEHSQEICEIVMMLCPTGGTA